MFFSLMYLYTELIYTLYVLWNNYNNINIFYKLKINPSVEKVDLFQQS